MPLITLVVPVYNAEKYLSTCVESILKQSFNDYELLLINDGSLDNSGKLCDEYSFVDEKVKVFHQQNCGVSEARNLGINNAQGKWIAFVDSDDWLDRDFLKNLIEKETEEVELLVGGYQTQNRKYEWNTYLPAKNFYKRINFQSFYEEHISSGVIRSVWGKLFLLRIIRNEKLLFDNRMSYGEDTLYTLNYLKNINSIFVINHAEYFYRYSEGSLCKNVTFNKWELFFESYKHEIHELLLKYNDSKKIIDNWGYTCLNVSTNQIKSLYAQKIDKSNRKSILDNIYKNLDQLSYDYNLVIDGLFSKLVVKLYEMNIRDSAMLDTFFQFTYYLEKKLKGIRGW